MNKKDLIDAVHGRVDVGGSIPRNAVDTVINNTLGVIQDELAGGGEVNITGFGKFEVTKLKARNGRNPKTGEALQITARNKVKFKAGATFKEAVNAE